VEVAVVPWGLRQGALDITMALLGVVDARTVGHKHQAVTQGLTPVVVVVVALIITLTTKEVKVGPVSSSFVT
jgi:hypothetical protein